MHRIRCNTQHAEYLERNIGQRLAKMTAKLISTVAFLEITVFEWKLCLSPLQSVQIMDVTLHIKYETGAICSGLTGS